MEIEDNDGKAFGCAHAADEHLLGEPSMPSYPAEPVDTFAFNSAEVLNQVQFDWIDDRVPALKGRQIKAQGRGTRPWVRGDGPIES